jgi:hypothetical protein
MDALTPKTPNRGASGDPSRNGAKIRLTHLQQFAHRAID